MLARFIKPVYAHCDLPCGVYDPAQARIEAEGVLAIMKKFDGLEELNKWRAITIKDQRADLVKQHLWVLWTDYFKPEHLELYPNLHELFWQATKQAGICKRSTDVNEAEKLLSQIDQIARIFHETQPA